MIKHQLFIGAALVAGVAIGYFAAPQKSSANVEAEETYVAKSAIADSGEAASIAALRARIAELEAKLAGKGEESAELIANAVDRLEGRARRNFERSTPRQFMEEMKKNNPEQYTQMTNRFAEWRQSRLERQQSKLDFLASIDTSRMSAAERDTHEKLQDLIVRRDEIETELQNLDLSNEDRRRIIEDLHEVSREIAHLNGEERKALLGETARALGLNGEDAEALSDTVRDIFEVTEDSRAVGPFGGMGGGRRGPRGGGRGR